MSLAIRPIRVDEVAVLQDFLRVHWNENHAFVRSRELLLWQHSTNPFKAGSAYADDELTFLGSWDREDLIAVLGEIPLDFTIRGRVQRGTWLALWKNRAEKEHGSAGLQLFHRITSGSAVFVGGIGINERVRLAYRLFRFQLFEDLPLYLVLNPEVESAMVRKKQSFSEETGARYFAHTPAPEISPGYRIESGPAAASEWDVFWSQARNDIVGTDRSSSYMRWRYLLHPHYRYDWVRVYDDRDALIAAGVYRIEEAMGERVMHVVEFLGDTKASTQLAKALCGVMREQCASFLAFRCARARSFAPWLEVGGACYELGDPAYEVPSLFQPVVPEYHPLVWGYRVASDIDRETLEDCYVTRSDGDQDRPSLIDSGSLINNAG